MESVSIVAAARQHCHCSGEHQNHGSRLRHGGWWRRRRRWWHVLAEVVLLGGYTTRATVDGMADRKWHGDAGRPRPHQRPSRGGSRPYGKHWINMQQVRVEAGREFYPAGHGIRPVQLGHQRFFGRSSSLRQNRHLIAATGAGGDLAVGNELFSRTETGLLAAPVNLSSPAIRKIDQPRAVHFNDSCSLVVKTRIVLGHRRIVGSGLAQFVGRTYSPRNHGIGINQATIAGLDCGGLRSGKNRQAGASILALWPSPVVAVEPNTIRSQSKSGNAAHHQQHEGDAANDGAG